MADSVSRRRRARGDGGDWASDDAGLLERKFEKEADHAEEEAGRTRTRQPLNPAQTVLRNTPGAIPRLVYSLFLNRHACPDSGTATKFGGAALPAYACSVYVCACVYVGCG